MNEITLTRGKISLVDDEDYGYLSQFKWRALYNGSGQGIWYAGRSPWDGKKQRLILMHREILDAKDGFFVDHVNSNGLDNRRENIRICTPSQNSMNKRISYSSTSGYKGVTFSKREGKWQSMIMLEGKSKWLGYFNTAEEAYDAYSKASSEFHREFGRVR